LGKKWALVQAGAFAVFAGVFEGCLGKSGDLWMVFCGEKRGEVRGKCGALTVTFSEMKSRTRFELYFAEDGMKATLLLRIAAVMALLHGVLHTIGGVFGKAAPGAQAAAVAAMEANRFTAMGVSRTYMDYLMGYGLLTTVKFLVETAVFWQLGSMAKTYGRQIRPLIMVFCVGYLASAVLAWRYFFAGPAVFEVVIALCLLGAWVLSGRAERTA
jgi:hypothetical protein